MKVLINGFGRIGRLVYRLLKNNKDFDVVAVNDLTTPETLAYLLEFDSAQGSFFRDKIKLSTNGFTVDGEEVKVLAERDPENLPLKDLGVELVVECTGIFRTKELASKHLKAGARKVVISAPASGGIKTVVFGVNESILTSEDNIVSGASCTTNCLAPIVKVLNENFGIIGGVMTTIHSATNDQRVLDLPHSDLRRGRSTLANIIPTSTGAAAAIGLVIPELKGRLDGFALRVPTITGSVVDFSVTLEKEVTVDEVNEAMKEAQNPSFGYATKPIVSTDIIGTLFGSIFDPTMTRVITHNGQTILKVGAWYDNEMSYVAQLCRTLAHISKL